ncbi:MAG: hypothetical protein FWD60_09370, partial [Candidatus Azobacteroides sp.]|nr:hypothetical protein [Candidatus Azobacteroides sp.]
KDEDLRSMGKTTPLPFIFTLDSIDDNDTIEAVINNPAYSRSMRVMIEIAKKAEARRKMIEEMAE